MKNKVLKQMLAFSLAVALVGGLLLLSQLTEQSQVQIRKQQQMQLRQPQLLKWTKRKDIFLIFLIKRYLHREVYKTRIILSHISQQ